MIIQNGNLEIINQNFKGIDNYLAKDRKVNFFCNTTNNSSKTNGYSYKISTHKPFKITCTYNNKKPSNSRANKVTTYCNNNPHIFFTLQTKKEDGGIFSKGLPLLAVIAMPIPGVNVAVNVAIITTVAVIAAVEINKQIKENKKAEEEKKKAGQIENNAPVEIKPPFDGAKLGDDPTKCPGPGFEWKGNGPPESGKGRWVNETTGETLHPDLEHPEPVKPHWDYEGPDFPKKGVRLFLDGSWEYKGK